MTRWIAWSLVALTALGCARVTTATIHPPLTLAQAHRPPLSDHAAALLGDGWIGWLGGLVNAYRANCTALSVLRGEDAGQCDRGLR